MSETVDPLVQVRKGEDPVCLQRATELSGAELKDFLVAEGILHKQPGSAEIQEPIGGFLKTAATTVYAFYFTAKGPMLMLFDVDTESVSASGGGTGLVAGLTGDSDLGQLFEPTGACARVFCCTKGSFEKLRRYAAGLPRE